MSQNSHKCLSAHFVQSNVIVCIACWIADRTSVFCASRRLMCLCVYLNEPLLYFLPSPWHLHPASQTLPASQQILCLNMAVSAVARAGIAFKRLTIPRVRFMRSSSTPPLITTTSPVSFFRPILNIKVTAKKTLLPSRHILRGVTGGERVSKNNRWGHTIRDRGLQVCGGAGDSRRRPHADLQV